MSKQEIIGESIQAILFILFVFALYTICKSASNNKNNE
jgi:hypothetical protein